MLGNVSNSQDNTFKSVLSPTDYARLEKEIQYGSSIVEITVTSIVYYSYMQEEVLDSSTCHLIEVGDRYLVSIKDKRTLLNFRFKADASGVNIKIGLIP